MPTPRSSRWAGSPSAIRCWSAASSTKDTSSPATATSTTARPTRAMAQFLADIRLAKAVLEDQAGMPVNGYRAPSFSVGPTNDWAFDCIAEAGYRYSSSVYPIRHDHYGAPNSPRFAHEVRKRLIEVPVATVRVLNANWPAGGGGYFRLLPYGMSRWSLRRVNEVDGQPAMFYFHPWELDPEQPRVPGVKCEGPLSPLPESEADGAAFAPTARGFPLGPRRPDLPQWCRLMPSAHGRRSHTTCDRWIPLRSARSQALTRRAGTPSSSAAPTRRSSIRSAGATIIEDVFRHRTHYLVAERGGRCFRECCRSRRCAAGCSVTRWSRCRSASTAGPRRTTPSPSPR